MIHAQRKVAAAAQMQPGGQSKGSSSNGAGGGGVGIGVFVFVGLFLKKPVKTRLPDDGRLPGALVLTKLVE